MELDVELISIRRREELLGERGRGDEADGGRDGRDGDPERGAADQEEPSLIEAVEGREVEARGEQPRPALRREGCVEQAGEGRGDREREEEGAAHRQDHAQSDRPHEPRRHRA